MTRFNVTARTEGREYRYIAIAGSSIDVVLAAFDRFGVCSVTVRPV